MNYLKTLSYRNPNFFQPDEGPASTVEASEGVSLSLRCPHCATRGVFHPVGAGVSFGKGTTNQTFVSHFHCFMRICPNPGCHGFVLTVSFKEELMGLLPYELLDFDGTKLPANMVETLKEAIACHSVGAYRAAAMMVRRLLEELCQANGAEGANLYKRLEALKSKVTLPQDLFDAMSELKALGNDAAHIDARDYRDIGEDEAADSIELAKEILKACYQLSHLVERLRARKAKLSE